MILNSGEYVHIIHRQLFPGDAQRHFVPLQGRLNETEELFARAESHTITLLVSDGVMRVAASTRLTLRPAPAGGASASPTPTGTARPPTPTATPVR